MATRNYRVRVVRGEVQIEAEGDKAFVLDMLKRFAQEGGGDTAVRERGGSPQKGESTRPRAAEPTKAVSPGEFVRQLGFKKHTDIVVAFGFYLEHVLGAREFTAADINNLYYEAKLENSNTSQMFINNIRRGFMMQAKAAKGGGKKRYTLTHTGENHVRAKLAK